jgi:hypothetical protein
MRFGEEVCGSLLTALVRWDAAVLTLALPCHFGGHVHAACGVGRWRED